ncbi:BTAD domain-containing putative transcriptional regulator [Amycolatopsis speibonae]|uniref:BTAD domain-containing putative transcriptional regulator n=1 Tax=Amycolatopsis speibonae TaxID=1450224 RepID=A0ABV7P0Q7_9PSEU
MHTYVSGLRRILEPSRTRWSTDGLLLSDASGYRLNVGSDSLDVHVFEQQCDTARTHWQTGDAASTVDTLNRALALWSGEALSGVPGPYAESLRTSLAEHRILALEMRAAALLKLGTYDDLVPELTVLVREHPLRESLWQSLMLALHRSGRTTEALDAFRNARDILRRELDIAPGPELAQVHQQILTNDQALTPALSETDPVDELLAVFPGQVAHAIEERRTTPHFCRGREPEIARLRCLADEVVSGNGRTAWIEGEPGIGKSELLTTALADLGERGCHVAWAAAGELGQLFPLQVIMECLGLEIDETATRSSETDVDLVATTADRILAYIDQLCATAPLVMVIDDLHWADDASVLMWNRLSTAARQLPLLLVAASRPVPRRVELGQVRRAAESRGLEIVELGPLADTHAEDLISDLLGAQPDEELRSLVVKAAGNPLYLREVTGALVRDHALETVDGITKVRSGTAWQAPDSLLEAVSRTLDQVDEVAKETLRRAAVLGMEFGLAQVAATMDKMPSELIAAFEDAMEMRIIVDTGTHLAFRHPMLRWALYHEIPDGARADWHRRAAKALAGIGSGVEHVAQQLVAVPAAVDDWVIDWLVDHHMPLANRAPLIATTILHRSLDNCTVRDPRREVLLAAYVLLLFRLDQEPLEQAQEAMVSSQDPDRAAEMRHIAAAMLHRRGETEEAIALLEGNDSPTTPSLWRKRRRALLANFSRGRLDDLGRTARKARQTYRTALADGEPYPIGHALQTLWLVESIHRDHGAALRHIDRAITTVEGQADNAEFYFDLLDNRIFTLQNLDRLEEARKTLYTARRAATKYSLPHGLQVSSAVQDYWRGSWDDALAELDTVNEDGPAITFHGLREPGPPTLLLHGLAGLVCGRRGDTEEAAAHLYAAAGRLPVTDSERESCDFLLVARSLQAEQDGDLAKAIDILAPIMDPTYAQMMLRHQWLPWLVRLARIHGREQIVTDALEVCKEEAIKEVVPARATAAAQWCEALASGNPEPLLQTIVHFGNVGRTIERASALSDVAVLLGAERRRDEAQDAADEAIREFGRLGAVWDMQYLESRMCEYDITPRTPEVSQPTRGWSSLTPVEREIAELVSRGRSNPEIADTLVLPRRTVQAHVTRILAKLGLTSRSGLAERMREPPPVSQVTRSSL